MNKHKGEWYMNKNELLEYVGKVFELESALRTQKEVLLKIEDEKTLLNNTTYKSTNMLYDYNCEDLEPYEKISIFEVLVEKLGMWFVLVGGIFVNLLIIDFFSLGFSITNSKKIKISLIAASVIIFIISYIVTRKENDTNIQRYTAAKERNERMKRQVDEENKKIQIENSKVIEWNKYQRERVVAKQKILAVYHDKLTDIINDTKNTLEEFYDMNIIYPKYRSLIPIASFCDYLKSGVCDELEGHEGCYNKFDLEVRLDTVINKIDDVLDNLDDIKLNQHTLYTEVVECNRKLELISEEIHEMNNGITGSMEEMKIQVAEAEEDNNRSNALLEYYAAETSRNVASIEWIKRLEYMNM